MVSSATPTTIRTAVLEQVEELLRVRVMQANGLATEPLGRLEASPLELRASLVEQLR